MSGSRLAHAADRGAAAPRDPLLGALLTAVLALLPDTANFVDLIESYSVTAVLALGVFVVLVAGGIDISFAATASVAQYVDGLRRHRLGPARRRLHPRSGWRSGWRWAA